ncbi:prolyl aminopeptidase [Erysipelothrix anatis]|uniref:prolyl aminopeptidase n=1 Tax=Erysipelothrix anatis TaxID=2683713 RepID=UPI0013585CBC|nr:prolyl aminopeptidase [Erysipelothrix anatis]
MEPTQYITTEDGQELAVYIKGNPEKPAVIFLHGGPGGRISEASFSFFDLNEWFVIAFDQRGCGNSKPFATLENNTPQAGVADIARIAHTLGISKWTVFGGSYGSTLALLYAIAYPDAVKALVLRGIFLGREEDVAWLYQEGASYFYPIEHEGFKKMIEPSKRHDLVSAYYEIFTGDDVDLKRRAAFAWSRWEGSLVRLVPDLSVQTDPITDADISLATLECHFFANKMFWNDDNTILNHSAQIAHIPTFIVHGRYDVDCRVSAAYELHEALSGSELHIVEAAGHSPYDVPMHDRLTTIMAQLQY